MILLLAVIQELKLLFYKQHIINKLFNNYKKLAYHIINFVLKTFNFINYIITYFITSISIIPDKIH